MFGFLLVLPLMLIIITGNLLRRFGFYSDRDVKVLSKTLYWVILPPLMFRTVFLSGTEVLTQINLLVAITLCYIVTIAVGWLSAAFIYHRGDRKRIAVSAFTAMRSNNVYLGFPVMFLAAGEVGLHNASTYLAVTMVSFQLLSIGAGEIAASGRLSRTTVLGTLKKLALNPLIISVLLGLAVALTGLRALPKWLDEGLHLMGSAATAIGLLALGGTLDLSSVRTVAGMLLHTWPDCLIKLLVNPLAAWLLLLLLPVPKPLMQATVMLTSMPCAVNCFIMAQGMDMDAVYAADLVAASTMLASVSIPLWSAFLGLG
jgi:malonate transporter